MKTQSIKNPPKHENMVIVVEVDKQKKPCLATGVRYKNGKWYGAATGYELFLFENSYWIEVPEHNEE